VLTVTSTLSRAHRCLQMTRAATPTHDHDWYIHSIRIITALWSPERVEIATRLCEELNQLFEVSQFARGEAPLCTLVPAVYGDNYTEQALQELITGGVLAEPPNVQVNSGLIDKVSAASMHALCTETPTRRN
jgi:hypothetical protein